MSTTSTSDHDMSDSASSPMSYIRYSPHSSPSQQVPQLATDLTELTCADNKQQFFRQGKCIFGTMAESWYGEYIE